MSDIHDHQTEVTAGNRFQFGDNRARFLTVLTDERIKIATESLKTMLDVETLTGKSFLDIGSGSGLFSLAARRLGAKVFSFDYDPQSVACTKELKRRFYENDPDWEIQEGSALDSAYLEKLGKFDIVYSWGVLHHTGDMWSALKNVDGSVADNGTLFLSLYNDQGGASKRWLAIKKIYCGLPHALQVPFAVLVYFPLEIRSFLANLARGVPLNYFRYIIHYRQSRGMSWRHDKIDWIGGYPFEVSKPEQIFYFYKVRGYELQRLKTCGGGLGCNEYVFRRARKRV